ncbi:MAG: nitrilase-related carbon-nitrogen hydrolase [Sphingobacteriia bacterium]
MQTTIQPFKALALQISTEAVNACADYTAAKPIMMDTINRVGKQIKASKAFIGADLQLVVLPEYFLTGFPMGESMEEWRKKACIDMEGDVYDSIKQIAIDAQVYFSGNVYELDPHFPELYFQTCFIIDPEGEIILRYRRLNSMYAPTPHDVLNKYIMIYGQESLFPVARTPIGNLACIASEEILYPEIARCMAMNGAEIFLHNTSEVGSLMLTPKNIAKLARSIENMAYVISANSAGINGYAIPANSTDGHSQIVNYEGLKLCEAGFGESMVANATIHVDALRQYRNRPGMANYLSRQRFELFAPTYNQSIYPANNLAEDQQPNRSHFVQTQLGVIEALRHKKVI